MHPLNWSVKGYFKPICAGEEPSPHAKFVLRWPNYRVWNTPLEALVDTGSPFTALSTRDAERFQISFKNLNRDQRLTSIGLGGAKFVPRVAKNAELIFIDEGGKRHPIKHEKLYVLEPDLPRKLWLEKGVYRFPNIIGMDFVKKWKARLSIDPKEDNFTMEFQE
ncbi:MAG: retropepsin-like aspartic protease [Methanobacteriota archaeon]